ncbi:MAG: hypothetical protein Q4G13_08590 [Moraxella sp.]|nr:hypothetical protein [Moraxella sp.]
MSSGIQLFNDNSSIVLATDTMPLCFHNKITHRLTKNNASIISLHKDDGYLSAYHIVNDDGSRFMDYGLFSPFGADGSYYFIADRMAANAHVMIEEYRFKLGLKHQARMGLQLFDVNGNETYNSNNKPINILAKHSIDVSDCWLKNDNGQFTGMYRGSFATHNEISKKTAVLFTNIPTGLIKFSHHRAIYMYDIRLLTTEGTFMLYVRPEWWIANFTNAHFPVDINARLEYFVVDITNL